MDRNYTESELHDAACKWIVAEHGSTLDARDIATTVLIVNKVDQVNGCLFNSFFLKPYLEN